MTDVMSHGVYPHDPLPGPLRAGMREVQTCGPYRAWVAPWGEMFTQRLSDGEWRRFPKPSPILEPPAYFPGATWQQNRMHA
jgi:hypothetical protein